MYPLFLLLGLYSADPIVTTDVYDDARKVIVVVDGAELRDPATKVILTKAERGLCLWERDIVGEHVEGYFLWFRRRVEVDRSAVMSIDEAADFFSSRLMRHPNAADYADRGHIWLVRGDHERAKADLDEAIRLDSRLARAFGRRSDCSITLAYRAQGGEHFSALMQTARTDAEQQLKLTPNDYLAHLSMAMVLSSFGAPETIPQALAEYDRVTELEPKCVVAYNNRAKSLLDLGRYAEGLADLNKAIELDPEYSDAYTNRAIVFQQRRQFDRAITDSTKAVEFNPYNVSAWNNRGNAYMELKQYDKALADFSECVELAPKSGDGYLGCANARFMMGELDPKNYDLAMQDVESALSIRNDDYKALNTKGNILKKLGRPQEAVKAFDDALQAVDNEAHAVLERDSITMQSWEALKKIIATVDYGNYNVERADWELAARYPVRGSVAAILANRADARHEIYKKSKDPADLRHVMNDISRAIVLDNQNPQYWLVRAQFHDVQKDFDRALFDLNQTLIRTPNSPDVLRMHARIAFSGGLYDVAWRDAATLRDLGQPLDDDLLDKLRKASGHDYRPRTDATKNTPAPPPSPDKPGDE